MALIDKLTSLANSIRAKTGASGKLTIPQMESEITDNTIRKPTSTKTITANGVHDVTNYASADVSVSPNVKTKSIVANGTYNAANDNADGYSSVNVNVPVGVFPSGTKTITANGTYDVTDKESVVVSVPTGSEKSNCWVLTLAENSTAGAIIDIAQSSWLASVFGDNTLSAALIRMGSVPNGSAYIKTYTQSNASGGGNCVRCNLNGNAEVVAGVGMPISSTTSDNQGFGLKADGRLTFCCKDSGNNADVLPAGSWMIVVAVE